MKRLLFFLFASLTLVSQTLAQTAPNNVPKPPLAELKKFNPYLGRYTLTGNFSGRTFKGTFEWKPAIQNWYLQSTIQLQYAESKTIDRELRIMMTWDAKRQKYRLWRFQTTPHASPDELEGEAKFVKDEMVQEWKYKDEKGNYTFRNRLKMINPNTLQIISEEEDEKPKKITRMGLTTCTRIDTNNKYIL